MFLTWYGRQPGAPINRESNPLPPIWYNMALCLFSLCTCKIGEPFRSLRRLKRLKRQFETVSGSDPQLHLSIKDLTGAEIID